MIAVFTCDTHGWMQASNYYEGTIEEAIAFATQRGLKRWGVIDQASNRLVFMSLR